MNPQIGAALIAVGGAVISVGGVVVGVSIAAGRTRKQKRGELAAAALSDYMKALAQSATVSRLYDDTAALSAQEKKCIDKEALDIERQAHVTGVHAKTMLLAFADSDVLRDLASWDRKANAADHNQQPVLLKVVNGIRRQGDPDADAVPESVGLGLMFGPPDEK